MATRQLAGARTAKPAKPRAAASKARAARLTAAEPPAEPAAAEGKVLGPGEHPPAGAADDEDDGPYEPYDEDDGPYEEGVDEAPVPASLTFTTAPKERRRAEQVGPEQITFELDGERLLAVRPAEASFVYLSLAGARSRPNPDKMADVVNFLDDCFDDASGAHLAARLRDPADHFEFEDLIAIMEKLLSQWVPKQARPRHARNRGARRG